MKDYLDKIKNYSKILTKCAKWQNTNNSLVATSTHSDKEKDYIYELYCYFSILKDLIPNYDLEYYKGSTPKENIFPKSPAKKNGYPFFYVVDKATNKKLYQVCAGTMIEAITKNFRSPDISFQVADASLTNPTYLDTKMIFDAKRKRVGSASEKLSIGQYSYFSSMIRELQQEKAQNTPLNFNDFKTFIGNCLITNKGAYCCDLYRNQLHNIKEVENFDGQLDLTKIKVIG